MRFCSSIK